MGRRARAALGVALAICVCAPSAAAAVPATFFGVGPQGPLDILDYPRMGQAHVGTLRFEIDWARTDRAPGTGEEEWIAADGVVASAARQGIQTLPFVFDTPRWVLERGGTACASRCGLYAPTGRRELGAFGRFLGAAVDRYGPEGTFWAEHPQLPKFPITAWQIWNEQNSPTFFRPLPKVRAYGKMIAAAHDAITARDPAAKIILGGMFGNPRGGAKPVIPAAEYLARLYRRPGAARDFDGVAAHPYAGLVKEMAAQVRLLHREINRAGDNASMWITEVGWASGGPPSSLNPGPEGQAERLTKAYDYFLDRRRKLRIKTVDWYSWRDGPDTGPAGCAWCRESGLLAADGTPKPSLAAFASLTGGA